jgi:hypothetical protein
LSFGRATTRHFAKVISGLALALGFLIQPFTAKRQALHDLIADSVVLVKPGKKVRWWWIVLCVFLGVIEIFFWSALIWGFLQPFRAPSS